MDIGDVLRILSAITYENRCLERFTFMVIFERK